MAKIVVARSAKLSDWASDVGLGKHIYKVAVTDEDPKQLVARGWAGETDWTLVKSADAGDLSEEEAIERLAKREKQVDPNYYPRIKGTPGIFKVSPTTVTNHIIVARAMAGESERAEVKLKAADFAGYLIHNAVK